MAQAPTAQELLAQKPAGLHQRLTTGAEDEEEDPLLAQTGCAAPYTRLEECLGDNDRNWTKCQKEVQALKACHDKQQQLRAAGASK